MKTDVVVSATPSPSVKPLRHIVKTGCRGEFQFRQKKTCSNSGRNLRHGKNNHFYFLFMFKQNVFLSSDIFCSKEQGTNCNFITFTAEYHQRIQRFKDDNIFRIPCSAYISKHVIGMSSQGQSLRVF